jgi:hypothetical protein
MPGNELRTSAAKETRHRHQRCASEEAAVTAGLVTIEAVAVEDTKVALSGQHTARIRAA